MLRSSQSAATRLSQPQFCQRFGRLDFPLLSDRENGVARQYGAVRHDDTGSAEPLHAVFVLDAAGRVRWAYLGDAPFGDNLALLSEVASLAADQATGIATLSDRPLEP